MKAAFRFPFRELVWKGYISDQNRKAGNEDFVGVSWSGLARFAGYTGFGTKRAGFLPGLGRLRQFAPVAYSVAHSTPECAQTARITTNHPTPTN